MMILTLFFFFFFRKILISVSGLFSPSFFFFFRNILISLTCFLQSFSVFFIIVIYHFYLYKKNKLYALEINFKILYVNYMSHINYISYLSYMSYGSYMSYVSYMNYVCRLYGLYEICMSFFMNHLKSLEFVLNILFVFKNFWRNVREYIRMENPSYRIAWNHSKKSLKLCFKYIFLFSKIFQNIFVNI